MIVAVSINEFDNNKIQQDEKYFNLFKIYNIENGEIIKIHGTIYKIRKMKDFSFVLLRTKRDVVQCVASKNIEIPVEESCVKITANVVEESRSKTGYEMHIEKTGQLRLCRANERMTRKLEDAW